MSANYLLAATPLLDLLFNQALRLFHVLLMLLAIGAAVLGGYLLLLRRWQARGRRLRAELAEIEVRCGQLQGALREAEQRIVTLEQRMEEVRASYDPARFQALHDHLQHAIAHEFVKGLNYVVAKSEETLAGLVADQTDLRDKQSRVMAKACELIQHAHNIVGLFGLGKQAPQTQLVNLRGVMEGVLKELFPYAEAQGVTLRPNLVSVEPVQVNRNLVAQLFSNVVHNACKYSPRGGVVDVTLGLEGDGDKRVCVTVRDRGRGIEPKDQERIFGLRTRGDGLVEPGSGLGLYYARQLARLHGGDLLLVESQLNLGSTFKITLPYA